MNLAAAALAISLAAEPVNLRAGEPAPYSGALCDYACAEGIRTKRARCEAENRRLQELLAEPPAETATLTAITAGLLVGAAIGLVSGVVLALKVTN